MTVFKNKILITSIIFMIAYLISGCQYQFGHGVLSERYSTVAVPYVEGDAKGGITTEVVRKLSTSGAFRYVESDGDLVLKIKLVQIGDETIGFRYDRNTRGKLKKSIVPSETRLTAVVEVELIDSKTNEVIRGPTKLSASADFDHTFYSSRNEINIYSIGQLNDVDAAKEAVMQPLNASLADQIVDYIINTW